MTWQKPSLPEDWDVLNLKIEQCSGVCSALQSVQVVYPGRPWWWDTDSYQEISVVCNVDLLTVALPIMNWGGCVTRHWAKNYICSHHTRKLENFFSAKWMQHDFYHLSTPFIVSLPIYFAHHLSSQSSALGASICCPRWLLSWAQNSSILLGW